MYGTLFCNVHALLYIHTDAHTCICICTHWIHTHTYPSYIIHHTSHNNPKNHTSHAALKSIADANANNKKKKKVFVKVGMVGDSQIGKTSMMVKFVEGKFNEDYIMTLGKEGHSRMRTLDHMCRGHVSVIDMKKEIDVGSGDDGHVTVMVQYAHTCMIGSHTCTCIHPYCKHTHSQAYAHA